MRYLTFSSYFFFNSEFSLCSDPDPFVFWFGTMNFPSSPKVIVHCYKNHERVDYRWTDQLI